MIEVIPQKSDAAFLYFHTRCSRGDEIAPFLHELQAELPTTYIWAEDGPIDGNSEPFTGQAVSHGTGPQRYWFVFPTHHLDKAGFAAAAAVASCSKRANSAPIVAWI